MRLVFVCFFVALVTLAGCRVDDVETGTEKNARLFAELAHNAARQGGVALRVKPGLAAKVEILSYDSPIFGAAVSLPADAVKSAKDPVLVITPAVGFSAEGTQDEVVGPPVLIRLFELGSNTDVKLENAALIALPFTTSAETDIYNLHAGLLDAAAKKWTYLTAERVENKRARVHGKTLAVSTFAALQALPPIEANTFFFRVLRKGEAVCEGSYRMNDVQTAGGVSVKTSASGEIYTKAMYGKLTDYYFTSHIPTNGLVLPDSGEIKFHEDFSDEDSRLLLNCGALKVYSEKIENQVVREETLTDWLSTLTYPAGPCEFLAGRTCTKMQGVVHVVSRFVFIDDADPALRAYVTYDVDFSWFAWEKLQ